MNIIRCDFLRAVFTTTNRPLLFWALRRPNKRRPEASFECANTNTTLDVSFDLSYNSIQKRSTIEI